MTGEATVRAILLLGLIGHKLLWELLKAQDATAREAPRRADGLGLRCVKSLKVVALLAVVVQTVGVRAWPIAKRPGALSRVGLALYLVGLGTAVLGRLHLGKSWTNLEDTPAGASQRLVTSGIYRLIRHPIYTGDLLLLIGLELALNSWLVLGAVVPLLVVVCRARAEERHLGQTFPEYEAYRKRTRMFLPFLI